MSPRISIAFLIILTLGTGAATADESNIGKVYREALKTETQAFDDFREVRAVDAATALKIPLETAKERVNVQGPSREEIDISILQKNRLQAEETARQRETIRAVHTEIDDMIVVTRRLLGQLREEEDALEQGTDIDLESLRAEMTAALEAAALAAEDDGERAKDMTAGMDSALPPPSMQALTDALVAAQAAAQAARSAANAEARAEAALPESGESEALIAAAETAEEAASAAAAAAHESAAAQATASAAARAQDSTTEAAAAETAADAAAEAVRQALLAALAAGEIEESVATELAAEAAAGKLAKAIPSTGHAGQSAPGSTSPASTRGPDAGTTSPSNPGPTTPARGISNLGEEGTGWIRLDSWYVIGPFPNPGRQNVDVSFPPESLIDLDAVHRGNGGRPIRWTFVQSAGEMVRPPEDPTYMIYYAYTEVFSDADRELWVAVGSDDNSRVWLNDQLIWKSGYGLKIWRRNEGFRRVLFRRGVNRILYRVENGHGASGFSFLIQTAPQAAD